MTPDQYQLVLAKLDLLGAKVAKVETMLDALAQQRGVHPQASTPSLSPKVQAALARYGENLPRDVRLRMRSRAICLVAEGNEESAVVSAIATGEGREQVNVLLQGVS